MPCIIIFAYLPRTVDGSWLNFALLFYCLSFNSLLFKRFIKRFRIVIIAFDLCYNAMESLQVFKIYRLDLQIKNIYILKDLYVMTFKELK